MVQGMRIKFPYEFVDDLTSRYCNNFIILSYQSSAYDGLTEIEVTAASLNFLFNQVKQYQFNFKLYFVFILV